MQGKKRDRVPAEPAELKLGGNAHGHHLVLFNEMQCHLSEGGAGCHHLHTGVRNALHNALQPVLLRLGIALQLLRIVYQNRALQAGIVWKGGGETEIDANQPVLLRLRIALQLLRTVYQDRALLAGAIEGGGYFTNAMLGCRSMTWHIRPHYGIVECSPEPCLQKGLSA